MNNKFHYLAIVRHTQVFQLALFVIFNA